MCASVKRGECAREGADSKGYLQNGLEGRRQTRLFLRATQGWRGGRLLFLGSRTGAAAGRVRRHVRPVAFSQPLFGKKMPEGPGVYRAHVKLVQRLTVFFQPQTAPPGFWSSFLNKRNKKIAAAMVTITAITTGASPFQKGCCSRTMLLIG